MDFSVAYNKVMAYIESRYGIVSLIGEVVNANTGDFDGEKITVDHNLDPESALFVLGHLFGHTVQWNSSEELRKLGQETVKAATPEQLKSIFKYEQNATRYFVQILHECGINNLDQWVSDFWYADWLALKEFYTNGTVINQREVKKNIVVGATFLLLPLLIPEFVPKKYESRWSFG